MRVALQGALWVARTQLERPEIGRLLVPSFRERRRLGLPPLPIQGGAGFIDTLEQALLDHVLNDGAYTPPTNWFIALSTTTPTEAGANFTEPSGNGYARVSTAAADWAAASGTAPAIKDNANAITFPTASGGSWGTVTHFGFFTASSGGTVQIWGALAVSKAIGDGDTASFGVGALDVKLGDPSDSF